MRDFKEYIIERIDVDDNGCWIWNKCLTDHHYGTCISNSGYRHTESAHRVSYRAFNGEIPKFGAVSHICRVAECVNPEHLVLVDLFEEEVFVRNSNTTGHIYTPMGRFNTIKECADAHNISCPTLYARFKNDDDYYQQR